MEARMDLGSEARFAFYVDALGSVIGHADRTGPLRDYCTGLIPPGERKSVEPVAVSLSIANHFASLPVGYRLYLPKEWAEDRARRDRAGVPENIRFKTKQQIALELIQRAHASGLPLGVLLMDLDYGRDSRLRAS